MAGGTFSKLSGKTRPGTYINFESERQVTIPISERGTMLIPLIDHPYGPEGEFSPSRTPPRTPHRAELGWSIYENENINMVRIKEAFKNAKTVIVYIPRQGAKASAASETLSATAQYGGARGNALSFAVVANPLGGFDVTKYLGTEELETVEGVETVEALIAADSGQWITFTGTGNLAATAKTQLSGGATAARSWRIIPSSFDAAEARAWNTMAFPMAPTGEEQDIVPSLAGRPQDQDQVSPEDAGKYRKAVMAGYDADYEGIINVTNGVVLTDGTRITAADATGLGGRCGRRGLQYQVQHLCQV